MSKLTKADFLEIAHIVEAALRPVVIAIAERIAEDVAKTIIYRDLRDELRGELQRQVSQLVKDGITVNVKLK